MLCLLSFQFIACINDLPSSFEKLTSIHLCRVQCLAGYLEAGSGYATALPAIGSLFYVEMFSCITEDSILNAVRIRKGDTPMGYQYYFINLL